jgi:inorganic pyrophosphatase
MKISVVTVEIPKGSNNKYAVDPVTGRVHLQRELSASLAYPADYGYIERTRTEAGEHLGAFVLLRNPIFPGVAIDTRVVGALLTEDMGRTSMKVITVPANDTRWKHIRDIEDVPRDLLDRMEFFLKHDKDFSPAPHRIVVSRGDVDSTRTLVDIAQLRFDAQLGSTAPVNPEQVAN